MTQHTPGPWVLNMKIYGWDLETIHNGPFMELHGAGPDFNDTACFIRTAPETAAELERVKAQRDELLKAAEKLTVMLRVCRVEECFPALLHLERTIAAAKGTTP